MLHRSGFTQVVGYYGPVGDALCTRAEEAFSRSLARGETTLQAVALARAGLDQPLTIEGTRVLYPLGWVQLTVYHRGPNLPLARPGTAVRPTLPARFKRQTVEVSGLPVLATGFIGRRLVLHEIRRRVRAGQRLLVLQGLGGLGKTALASQLLSRVLAPGELVRQLILPCGTLATGQEDAMTRLTAYVMAHGTTHALPNWSAQVQAIGEQNLPPVARFTAVLQALWQAIPGLIVYADNVETLQEGPATAEDTEIGHWQPQVQGWWEALAALAEQGLTVLASTRYLWPGLREQAWVSIPPMSPADTSEAMIQISMIRLLLKRLA